MDLTQQALSPPLPQPFRMADLSFVTFAAIQRRLLCHV